TSKKDVQQSFSQFSLLRLPSFTAVSRVEDNGFSMCSSNYPPGVTKESNPHQNICCLDVLLGPRISSVYSSQNESISSCGPRSQSTGACYGTKSCINTFLACIPSLPLPCLTVVAGMKYEVLADGPAARPTQTYT